MVLLSTRFFVGSSFFGKNSKNYQLVAAYDLHENCRVVERYRLVKSSKIKTIFPTSLSVRHRRVFAINLPWCPTHPPKRCTDVNQRVKLDKQYRSPILVYSDRI